MERNGIYLSHKIENKISLQEDDMFVVAEEDEDHNQTMLRGITEYD